MYACKEPINEVAVLKLNIKISNFYAFFANILTTSDVM